MAGGRPAIMNSTEYEGENSRRPQVQFLEEVVDLVVDDDEGREVLDLDAPAGLDAGR
jgi:hypothetical protein